ncbi:helix-turn-helix transcriptional regulator [Arthrobacter sp. B1805]|uniref:helix-turn-helix transcriptional regulator n=1 Tax=Arthrobacter sp. B1805 TaxID=2058892 RepID=UPI000CE474B5|nr:helix-turn-helix transcriptional regulator [Arthrobacter sp. B1805]
MRHSLIRETVLESLVASHRRPLLLGITGAGGSGKSTLLGMLEARYRAEGVTVRRDYLEVDSEASAGRSAVFVDDAHSLKESDLAHVHSLLRADHVDVIIAYRPWPRTKALRELVAAIKEQTPPIKLKPWSLEEIDDYAASSLGMRPSADVVDKIAELTGGMPWLVQRVVSGLHDSGSGLSAADLVSHQGLTELADELEEIGGISRDTLLVMAVGDTAGVHPFPGLGGAGGDFEEAIARAKSAGLLLPTGQLIPLVQQALLAAAPRYRVQELQKAIVDTLESQGLLPTDVARALARSGFKDQRVAHLLVEAGNAALAPQPDLAAALYADAVSAGANELALAARRAQAALALGDLDTAGRLLDDLLMQSSAPDLRRGVNVSATVWAQRGMLARGAEVYRWLGPERVGSSGPLAAVAMVGSGDRDGARQMLDAAAPSASPTVLAVATTLVAQGIYDTLGDRPQQAVATLIRASNLMTSSAACIPLPDLPAALGAVVALHHGDIRVAHSILDAALAGNQGGDGGRPRLILLRAWVAMQEGHLDQARSAIDEATEFCDGCFGPRDQYLLDVLEVAVARRTGSAIDLVTAWSRAQESVSRVSVDLYNLLPLGELMVAAARLRESRWLEPHIEEAWALLARLGNPTLWAIPLHWSAVQAAMLNERPDSISPHASALVRASSHSHAASAFATAGRVWISVLGSKVDVAAVESAAHGLSAVGRPWDGSRLAGHAAARASEGKDMSQLLACARGLNPSTGLSQQAPPSPEAPSPGETGTAAGPTPEQGKLSAREYEVAHLVLQGRTYREIGETMYISMRTVEHHMARMRRRLGAKNRSELLMQLRLILRDTPDSTD